MNVLFCVGSVIRGDDAAGPYLAKLATDSPIEGWDVIDGGQTPEDELRVVRRMRPERVVLVDAADMGLPAGQIRRVGIDDVAESFLITTHALPISFLLSELESLCGDVVFLGIQPADLTIFNPMTPSVREAADHIFDLLCSGGDFSSIEKV